MHRWLTRHLALGTRQSGVLVRLRLLGMLLIVLSLARDQVGFTKFCVSAVACALQIIAGSIDQSLGRSVLAFGSVVVLI